MSRLAAEMPGLAQLISPPSAPAPGAYPPTPIATLPKTATSYVATGLQVGTTYYFVIKSFDSAGNESGPSNEISKSIL